MPKYTATFAANVRVYAPVTVEAADDNAAHQRFQELAAKMNIGWSDGDAVFDPEWDTLADIEYLEDCGMDETK